MKVLKMKVIKPQDWPPGKWKKEVTCSCCHAVLEIDEKDLTRQRGGDMREGWDYCQYRCPECGDNQTVQNEAIPEPVLKRITIPQKSLDYYR